MAAVNTKLGELAVSRMMSPYGFMCAPAGELRFPGAGQATLTLWRNERNLGREAVLKLRFPNKRCNRPGPGRPMDLFTHGTAAAPEAYSRSGSRPCDQNFQTSP